MVNTKEAPRRNLRYGSFEDFERDVDAIEATERAGSVNTTGNWTAGQIMEHLGKFSEYALDGFPSRAPWAIRKLAILMFKKKMLSGEPMPAGFKIPRQASYMAPGDDVSVEDGIVRLRGVFARLHAGEKFSASSPVFERLSHEQWCKAQLGHAAMHMSFIALDQPLPDQNDDAGDGDGGK